MAKEHPGATCEPGPAAAPSAVPGSGPAWGWIGVGSLAVLAVAGLIAAAAWWYRGRPAAQPTLAEIERLIVADRFADAERQAQVLLVRDASEPSVLFALARARAAQANWIGMAKALRQVPAWSIRKAEALYREGKALRLADQGRAAEAAFRECIRVDPNGAPALESRMELINLYAMEDRRDDFLPVVWDAYERQSPGNRVLVLTMRMRYEFEQAKPENNIESIRRLVAADPHDVHARAGLASARDRAGDHATARQLYASALADAPADPNLRERYLDLLYRTGDFETLQAVLDDRPPSSEERAKTAKFLGVTAEKRGDLAAAAQAYAKAAQANPSEAEYHYKLAQVLHRQGKTAEATAESAQHARQNQAKIALRKAWNEYSDALEATPPRVTLDHMLGMARACEAYGWQREGEAWYREVLRYTPENAEALAALQRQVPAVPSAHN